MCRVLKRNEHLHQGAAKVKGKGILHSVRSETNKRKYSTKVSNSSLEGNSSEVVNVLDVSNGPIHANFFNETDFEIASTKVYISQTEYQSLPVPQRVDSLFFVVDPWKNNKQQSIEISSSSMNYHLLSF